jgi:hypothetical protein
MLSKVKMYFDFLYKFCSKQFQKNFQQDDTLVLYFIISCKSLYMFRVKQSPIFRSSIKLYLQHLVLTNSVFNRAPDDGRLFHLKHVERFAGNNKILYKSVILLELSWN